MTIPTFTPRRRPTETGTSPRKEEVVEREWNFLVGLAAKALRLYSSAASGSVLTSDSQGNASWGVTLPTVGTLARTGGTITETATLVDAASGEYNATVYVQCTTAGAAGTLDVTFSITDDVGAATIEAISGLSLAATGRGQNVVALRCSGGGIDYALTVTGAAGGPVYAGYISVAKVR